MNREDIIRMAREAGFNVEQGYLLRITGIDEDLERFAALVASAERDKHKWDIHSCSPTCNRYACVATREAVLAERETCAKVCDEQMQGKSIWIEGARACSLAIRARGQA